MADETPPLDAARLAEIRQRADAATPGPWHIHLGFIWPEYAAPYHEDHDDSITGWTNRDADRTFIANAREDIPALLAEVDRLRAREAAARDMLRRLAAQFENVLQAEYSHTRDDVLYDALDFLDTPTE